MKPDGDLEFAGYIGIPRHFITPDLVMGVHLYLHVGGRFLLYRSGEEPLDADSQAKLQRRNVETVYVQADQHHQIERYVVDHVRELVAAATTRGEQSRALRDATHAVLRSTLASIVTARDFERVRRVSDVLAERIAQDASLLSGIVRFVADDERLFVHSANVAAYSVVLAARIGEFSDEQLSSIGVGALVHDIGLARIEPELLAKPLERRTDLERHFLARHPRRGTAALEQAGVNDGIILDIVRNHHGLSDGDKLSLPAQIVQLADVFDSLTSQPRRDAPHGPFAALYEMRHRMSSRFSPTLVREFVLTLGGMTEIAADSPVAPLSRRRASESGTAA